MTHSPYMLCPNCDQYKPHYYTEEGLIDEEWRKIYICQECGTKWFIKTDYTIDNSGPYPVRHLRSLRVMVPK